MSFTQTPRATLINGEPAEMLAALAAQGVAAVNDPIQSVSMMSTLTNPICSL